MTDRYLLGKRIVADVGPPNLDFTLVERFADYQPCVEVSRGCGMGCSFCAEAAVPMTMPRPPNTVANALLDVVAAYKGDIRPCLLVPLRARLPRTQSASPQGTCLGPRALSTTTKLCSVRRVSGCSGPGYVFTARGTARSTRMHAHGFAAPHEPIE